ncbi:MAG: response regulator [Deltaproteobacteria bacterium]|nr:response regulator [Deltaproteobacteria bacterium]
MTKKITILVSDHNKNVREYIKREISKKGYSVYLAQNSKQVFRYIEHDKSIDLLILDPEMPDLDENTLLEEIHRKNPALPVIIHTLSKEYKIAENSHNIAAVIEKIDNSVESLQEVISWLFKKRRD